MIALLGYRADDAVVVLAAITLMGSILGFLRYNTYPATVFMGDGGSQFLGFSAGVLAILLTQDDNPMLSSALPLLLLGLPILDTLYVMFQRISQGHSPFHADKNHIHHKLLSPRPRTTSPLGCSILMISAPISARLVAISGPANNMPSSTTRRPLSGPLP